MADLSRDRAANLVRISDLREVMVNGFDPPGPEWTPAHEREFVRARVADAHRATARG